MDPKMTPDQRAMSVAVMNAAKTVCVESLIEAMDGGPSMKCGRIGNGKRSAVVLVLIGTEAQTSRVWAELDDPLKRFCSDNGLDYRGIEFDAPGGA